MTVTIITKNSSAAGAAPSPSQLVRGELAVNVTDRKIYTLDASNNVVILSSGPVTLTTTGTSGAATLVSNNLNIPVYGDGTVKSVSVASANGFTGTVANPTTTPAITLGTSITGLIKGNGGGLFVANAGSDYQAPIGLTTLNTTGAATFAANILNIPQYQGVVSLTTTGTSGAATFASNALNIPQYQGAITLTNTGTSGVATLVGNTLNIPNYSTYTAATPTVLGAVYGATGASNTALGNNVSVGGSATSAVAIGVSATVPISTSGAVAVGASASATGSTSVAVGGSAVAFTNTVAVGNTASALSNGSIAIGYSADTVVTNANNSVAIGATTSVSSASSVALGDSATVAASSANSVAIGLGASCTSSQTIAIGQATTSSGLRSIGMGQNSVAGGAYAIALGYTATVNAQDGIVIGRQSTASNTRSIILGLTASDASATAPVIILSTQSSAFAPANEGFFVSGMRATTPTTGLGIGSLQFNATTKEILSTTDAFTAYGVNWQRQAAPAGFTTATTLTAAQISGSMITTSGTSSYALTLPTGTAMDTYFATVAAASLTNISFDFVVINTSSTAGTAVTMTAAVGFTIIGSASVSLTSSAIFRIRRSAANTYVMYRIAS